MNKEGRSFIPYVVALIVLMLGAWFVTYFFKIESSSTKSSPLTTTTIDTTTTKAIDYTIYTFSSSLKEIISDYTFFDDYNTIIIYNGLEFDFVCTNYDEETSTCNGGSALMKENDILYPLYTYETEEDNYLLRSDDFYIIFLDDIVIISSSNTGVKTGTIRIYDRSGNSLATFDSLIMGYYYNEDTLVNRLYPNIEDNSIYYYTCTNNVVTINQIDLSNMSSNILETIDGKCY